MSSQLIEETPESVLKSTWQEPSRPYSQTELFKLYNDLFYTLSIVPRAVQHEECGHRYYVKFGGMKHKQLQQSDERDIGNCSICWKMSKTPPSLRMYADEFIGLYQEQFPSLDEPPSRLSYFNLETFRIFYTWLFKENF